MSLVKSFSVGNGDMFYIQHNSDNFTIIDCCIDESNKKEIFKELKEKTNKKSIIRFISTHPDHDHMKGLKELFSCISIPNFYCVENQATKEDYTEDFVKYCKLRDSDEAFYLSKKCKRYWMNLSDNERGSSGINILWPILNNRKYKQALLEAKNGNSPNNISPIIRYSVENSASFLWLGDLKKDFMESIESELHFDQTDIIFAPHHGRNSGKIPLSWLKKINPKVIVIGEASSEHLHYYPGYNTIKQNSAGAILFDCEADEVHIYVKSSTYEEDDFLDNKYMYGKDDLCYLGTLQLNQEKKMLAQLTAARWAYLHRSRHSNLGQ